MTRTTLHEPVTVLVGPGAHRELASLFDLLEFLNEWPSARRGPIYVTAYKACNAALAGQLTTEQARQSFVAFARVSNALPGSAHRSHVMAHGAGRTAAVEVNGLPTPKGM